MSQTVLSCRCGTCRLSLEGAPIQAVTCHCESCRSAAERMEALPGAPRERTEDGGTPFVLVRKDCIAPTAGQDHLAGFRLNPDSPTRRAVATCCNSPMFLDFQRGHWLSVNAARWPGPLPPDLPHPDRQGVGFLSRLLGAWVRMGFRTPKLDYPRKDLADV